MHQPIYYPYESPVAADTAGRFSFSVVDVHNQRFGPYTTWALDAINAGLGLGHLGAQISFSGSLIENLNALEAAGVNGGMWNNWGWAYRQGASAITTSLGNPRQGMVAFGYHPPLMPLLDDEDIRMQIRLHKHVFGQSWATGPGYTRGMFPAETAFSERMIPSLVAEGIEWGAASPEPSDFEVWTLAYDVSGLAGMTLQWRIDKDGVNPLSSIQNETYAGGNEVEAWVGEPMSAAIDPPPPGGILAATYRATRYAATVAG